MLSYMIIGAAILALLSGICWAGSSDPSKSHWPASGGLIWITISREVPNGKGDNTTPAILAKWIAPFDCYVRQVYETLYHGTAGLDLITLRTIDATKKTIVAQVANPGTTDVDGVLQTLHSDIVNVPIVAGNGIEMAADSSQTNEAGFLCFQIGIEPRYQRQWP